MPILGLIPSAPVRNGVLAPPGVTAGPTGPGSGPIGDFGTGVPPPPGGWFPSIPVPPPVGPGDAVKFGAFAAGFLIGDFLAGKLIDFWRWLNSRPKVPGSYPSGVWTSTGGEFTLTVAGYSFRTASTFTYCPGQSGGPISPDAGFQIPFTSTVTRVNSYQLNIPGQKTWEKVCDNGSSQSNTAFWSYIRRGNQAGDALLAQFESGTFPSDPFGLFKSSSPANTGVVVTGVTINGELLPLPSIPDPLFTPPAAPEPEAEPETPPRTLPPLRPPVAPPAVDDPDAAPLPPPGDPAPGSGAGQLVGPGSAGLGQLIPLRPPLSFPVQPGQQAPPSIDTGTPVAPPTVTPVPVTPPGTEVIPGGVIGQPGTSPPPTLVGIASEVGRIEQKVRAVLDKPSEGSDLTDLLQLLSELLEFLKSLHGPGSYTLTPVCEAGDSVEAEWSAGVGTLDLVSKKIDALAELLQAHKNMRQPICHVKAVGQPVTVNFREV